MKMSLLNGRYTGAVALLAAAAMMITTEAVVAQNTQHYVQTNLVSNQASLAPTVDANLANPWGLSRSSKGPWWVADNGTGLSTLYDGTGKTIPLVVTIPSGDTSASLTGSPTGTVFNGDATAFVLPNGKAASFLFVTEDGTISGWNGGTSAVIVVNRKQDAVYKGATVGTRMVNGVPKSFLYAANFRSGKVDVYDSTFAAVMVSGGEAGEERGEEDNDSFTDEHLPRGYAPFNVQNLGGNIFVSFAKQDSARHDEVDGAGLGYVDVFSPAGKLLQRMQHGAWFDAPWGMAIAPSDFGAYSHDVLVGQFGSGRIAVFNPVTGKFLGMLENAKNEPITIDGLWALSPGNGASAGPATSMYFTAGIDHEKNGLFGTIAAVENVQGNDQ